MKAQEPNRLFESLRLAMDSYWQSIRVQADANVLVVPHDASERVCQTLFSNLARGGFCASLVSKQYLWNPRSADFEAARAAARKGCVIERAFLLPLRYLRNHPTLLRHLELDNAAGIKTHVLYVGDLLRTLESSPFESPEFGLWDGEILSTTAADSSGSAPGLRLSSRSEDIGSAEALIETLKCGTERLTPDAIRSPADWQGSYFDLRELMLHTAPVADFLSKLHCTSHGGPTHDCSWYHSVWQYLRLFNIVSGPTWYADFYESALRPLARSGEFSRVLICGAADYTMLASIVWAYRLESREAEATVLDACETPLTLCRWYAKLMNTGLTTAAANILAYEPRHSFDLVITDAFLTQFTSETRGHVVNKWASLLRPGGRAITTMRVKHGPAAELTAQTPLQIETFRQLALREARRWNSYLSVAPETIADKARKYLERIIIYAFRSEEEIRQLFESNHFRVEAFHVTEFPATQSTFVKIVAERV